MPGSAIISITNFSRVEFAITHCYVDDLHMTLQSPIGTTVILKQRAGQGDSSGLDASITMDFTDSAATAIGNIGTGCGQSAVEGVDASCPDVSYIPSNPLSSFNGENAGEHYLLD
jgi:hypothetical protein